MKHYDPNKLGGVYLAYTPMSITEGSQDRNSNRAGTWRQEPMQRPWRGAAYWLAPHGLAQSGFFCFVLFCFVFSLMFYEPGFLCVAWAVLKLTL